MLETLLNFDWVGLKEALLMALSGIAAVALYIKGDQPEKAIEWVKGIVVKVFDGIIAVVAKFSRK